MCQKIQVQRQIRHAYRTTLRNSDEMGLKLFQVIAELAIMVRTSDPNTAISHGHHAVKSPRSHSHSATRNDLHEFVRVCCGIIPELTILPSCHRASGPYCDNHPQIWPQHLWPRLSWMRRLYTFATSTELKIQTFIQKISDPGVDHLR